MSKEFSKIHPELQKVAKTSPKFNFNQKNLWFMRFLMSIMPKAKIPIDIFIKNIFCLGETDTTKIRLRVYTKKSVIAPSPVLIWMHGGGYIVGKPEQDDACCSQYAQELGITVVSIDYRCAPEHPFPAALDDCYAALKWVATHSQEFGIDPNRIAIGGNSAGGGLAAALAQLVFDRQEFKVVFQLLVYPMLDDRTVLLSIDDSQNVTWTQKSNQFGWQSYLGLLYGTQEIPNYAVPARRQDLKNLPPAWIGVGSLDVFHNEDVLYAQRLQESGVDCTLNVVEGAFHGFDVFDSQIRIVQDFRKSQISALSKFLFPRSNTQA